MMVQISFGLDIQREASGEGLMRRSCCSIHDGTCRRIRGQVGRGFYIDDKGTCVCGCGIGKRDRRRRSRDRSRHQCRWGDVFV